MGSFTPPNCVEALIDDLCRRSLPLFAIDANPIIDWKAGGIVYLQQFAILHDELFVKMHKSNLRKILKDVFAII